MGDYCFIGPNTRIWSRKNISIGNNCLIGHGCNIIDSNTHPLDSVERHKQFILGRESKTESVMDKEIVIEDDVWIACNCIVLKGTIIHKGAIIGAGSIVGGEIPPYSMVHGELAKIKG